MTNYSAEQLKEISKLNDEHHIGLLTDCGIHRDFARKIVAMSDAEIASAIAQFAPIANKSAMQTALVAAASRETLIRA